jgi:hypothetical protein
MSFHTFGWLSPFGKPKHVKNKPNQRGSKTIRTAVLHIILEEHIPDQSAAPGTLSPTVKARTSVPSAIFGVIAGVRYRPGACSGRERTERILHAAVGPTCSSN